MVYQWGQLAVEVLTFSARWCCSRSSSFNGFHHAIAELFLLRRFGKEGLVCMTDVKQQMGFKKLAKTRWQNQNIELKGARKWHFHFISFL